MQKHIYKIAYMGYSSVMMQYLLASDYFELVKVVGVQGRMSDEQYGLISQKELLYKELMSKKDISSLDDFLVDVDVIIMYKFEYILPYNLIHKYPFYNFHGGSLRENRGAHAVVWSIINMDKKTCLSVYKLTGGIDVGLLLGEYFVEVTQNDTVKSLNEKLTAGIPQLLTKIYNHEEGNNEGVLVESGHYNPKISERDYTIVIEKDTIEQICAKIRSQMDYNGAVYYKDGVKYRVKKYTYGKEMQNQQNRIVTIKRDDAVLNLFLEKANI